MIFTFDRIMQNPSIQRKFSAEYDKFLAEEETLEPHKTINLPPDIAALDAMHDMIVDLTRKYNKLRRKVYHEKLCRNIVGYN